MRIAVLALQGAFIEHEMMLERLGAETFEVRKYADWFQQKDALIIPGGESTTMGKILRDEQLLEPIRTAIKEGLPVMGTCAGMILLAKNAAEANGTESGNTRLATMDISVKRNAYGRQLGSFETTAAFKGLGEIPMTFIRAPYIEATHGDAETLATVDGRIVAARQGKQLACAFHPELTESTCLHEYFLSMI
ncbi:MAG: pyridoxal 5'-phosphate synthase glutaminase subunit PdxT [Prevotellaceae bacterium]|nr:pyridoxal 5'-phosphate synthase glutaminase subunit PdxT [Candidatus Minthosoma caballi]